MSNGEKRGLVLVPEEPPFEADLIVVGTRIENDKRITVYLAYDKEGGGWYQWTTHKAHAKRFGSPGAAMRAAKGCPGPYYLEPMAGTVGLQKIESKRSGTYREMIRAGMRAAQAGQELTEKAGPS